MEKLEFVSDKNAKIIDILQEKGLNFNQAFKALREKDIKIQGKRIKTNQIVEVGSNVEVFYSETEAKLEKIYEDENVIVINKPRNIEVVGQKGVASKLNAIALHRLDRNTTGLVMLAKNPEVAKCLEEGFKNKWITKKYICQVYGHSNFNGQVFEGYLLKDAKESKVKIFSQKVRGGKLVQTKLQTLENLSDGTSFVLCQLLTGRTHQIRVHLSFLGHPIVGDGKYGKNEINKKFNEKYQKLHCFYLKIDKIDKKFEYLQNKEFVCQADFYKIK